MSQLYEVPVLIKKVMFGSFGIIVLFVALVAYALYMEVVHDDCGLSEELARKKVQRFLSEEDLPLKFLEGPTAHRGTCSYTYYYEGKGQELGFMILDTMPHGLKLIHWNNEKDNPSD